MKKKSHLGFSFEVFGLGLQTELYTVAAVVDGAPLSQLVFEFNRARGVKSIQYGGIIPERIPGRMFDRYWLKDVYRSVPRRICVLICSCGEPGCGSLKCRVAHGSEATVWDQFESSPGRDYSQFGPFVFDTAQYRSAARKLERSLRPVALARAAL